VGLPESLITKLRPVDGPFFNNLPKQESPVVSDHVRVATRLHSCRLGIEPLVSHLSVRRIGYTHHGIALGDGTVVHFTGEPLSKWDACVQRTSREDFLRGGEAREENVPPQLMLHRSLIALLALLHVGMRRYHLRDRNCEHFATYCQSGGWHSHQVHDLQTAGLEGKVAKVLEIALDATLGRAVHFLERLNAPTEDGSKQTRSGDGLALFYGDIWCEEEGRVWVQTPVRQTFADDISDLGFWGVGTPWDGVVDWTRTPPNPKKVVRIGEVFVDDQLSIYLNDIVRGWLRAQGTFTARSLPPLPEPHPALVERKYPMEWFD
jgi:hypothetical protein